MDAEQKKECRACRNPIHLRATRCPDCGAHQSPLPLERTAGYVALLLSLLISAVAVSSAFLQNWEKAFGRKEAKVEFDIVSSSSGLLWVLVRNEGNLPAVVTDGMISNRPDQGPLMAFRIPFEEPFLVEAGKYKLIQLAPIGGVPEAHSKMKAFPYQCRVSLRIAQQGTDQHFKSEEFSCIPNTSMREFFEEIKVVPNAPEANRGHADS